MEPGFLFRRNLAWEQETVYHFVHLPRCMLGYHTSLRKQTPPRSRHSLEADTCPPPPRAVHAWRYGQQAGGMHPTGMQSCSSCLSVRSKRCFCVF